MLGWIAQTLAVTSLGIRNIPQRLGSSLVAIVGIAGFRAAMTVAGSPSRALVMRSGADSEMTSGIGGPEADLIKQAPGLLRRQSPHRVCRELCPRRSQQALDSDCRQRAASRRRADRLATARRSEAGRRPDVSIRHE